jgi:hypothetical protein
MTSYTRDAFTARYLNRRGNHSVPKKYLKTAQWALIDNEEGYFCHHSGLYYPVEFNYDHGYWSQIEYRPQNSAWLSWKATPTEWGLDIETDEFTTRDDWGLLDGEEDPETDGGLTDAANRFQGLKLDVAGPEDIDVKIATTEREQQAEDRLGEIIKNLTIRPKSRAGTSQYLAPSITAMMSTTMTQNQPTPTYTRRTGGGDHPVEDHPLEADSSAAASDLSVEGHQEEAEEAPLEVTPEGTKQLHQLKVMAEEENSKEKSLESSMATKTRAKSSNSNGTSMSPSITM